MNCEFAKFINVKKTNFKSEFVKEYDLLAKDISATSTVTWTNPVTIGEAEHRRRNGGSCSSCVERSLSSSKLVLVNLSGF